MMIFQEELKWVNSSSAKYPHRSTSFLHCSMQWSCYLTYSGYQQTAVHVYGMMVCDVFRASSRKSLLWVHHYQLCLPVILCHWRHLSHFLRGYAHEIGLDGRKIFGQITSFTGLSSDVSNSLLSANLCHKVFWV